MRNNTRETNLLNKIYTGLRGFSMIHARSSEQAKDFLQEGLMYAFEAIKKYPDKSDDELVRIIAKSANNRVLTLQGNSVTHGKRHSYQEDYSEFFHPESQEEEIEVNNFIRVLRSRLPVAAQQVLDERLEPSKKTIDIVEAEHAKKIEARERGRLVMNVHESKIQDVHIGQALGYSKATVSRNASLIRQEAEVLLNS